MDTKAPRIEELPARAYAELIRGALRAAGFTGKVLAPGDGDVMLIGTGDYGHFTDSDLALLAELMAALGAYPATNAAVIAIEHRAAFAAALGLTEEGEAVSSDVSTPLSDDERVRFRQVFGRMPYAALSFTRNPETVGDIIDALDKLAAVLRGVAKRENESEVELYALRQQRTAVGKFILDAIAAARPTDQE